MRAAIATAPQGFFFILELDVALHRGNLVLRAGGRLGQAIARRSDHPDHLITAGGHLILCEIRDLLRQLADLIAQ